MNEQRIDRPVRVSDNGVRSFIPPTFCFDLIDDAGVRVATVSRVVLDSPPLRDFDLVATFTREHLRATGAIAAYDAGEQAREAGRCFTIRRAIDEAGNRWPP